MTCIFFKGCVGEIVVFGEERSALVWLDWYHFPNKMGKMIDPSCAGCSLKRLTIGVLIMYLISAVVHLLAGIYHLYWEVSKSTSSLDLLPILLLKYSICIIALLAAFLGICKNQAVLLVPTLTTRLIICVEDVIDVLWFIFKGQTIVPTSLPVAYTENFLTELTFGCLFLAIAFYFFAIIYSYYCELKEVNSKNTESSSVA